MSQTPPQRSPDTPEGEHRPSGAWPGPPPGQPAYGEQPPTYAQQPPYGQPPYGPPPYGPPSAPRAGSQQTARRSASVADAFRYAWQGFTASPGPWLLAAAVLLVVGGIGSSVEATIRSAAVDPFVDPAWGFTFVPAAAAVNLLFSILNLVIAAGLMTAALRTLDGRRVGVAEFLSIPNLGQAVLAAVLLSLATMVGLFLLVVPGLVVAVLGMWYLQFALDRRLRAVDALLASARLVRDHPGPSIVLILAAVGVAILGALALVVGLLVALPMITMASAFLFRRLAGGPVMVPGSAR